MAKQPFVPVPGVIRFRYVGTNQGSNWVNGFAAQYTGVIPTEAQLATLATSLRTAWTTNLAQLYTTSVNLVTVQVWDIGSDTGATGVDSVGSAGSVAPANPLPVNCATTISWPVNKRWRGGHFRTYSPARNGGDVISGRQLLGTYQTALRTQYAAWRTAVNQLVLGSMTIVLSGVRYFPTGFNADGTPITKTSGDPFAFGTPVVHGRLDTQRRRLGKEIS